MLQISLIVTELLLNQTITQKKTNSSIKGTQNDIKIPIVKDIDHFKVLVNTIQKIWVNSVKCCLKSP